MTFNRSLAARGAFHHYARGVFADHSKRSRVLRARRMRWLRRVGRHASSPAEGQWKNADGSMW